MKHDVSVSRLWLQYEQNVHTFNEDHFEDTI